jgi:seryl-tRNA synthetase
MLDLKYVRDNLFEIDRMLANRNMSEDDRRHLLGNFQNLDQKRRALLSEVEALKARRNQVNEEITALKKSGRPAFELIEQMKDVSVRIKELDPALALVEEEEEALLLAIPNRPDNSVPVGPTEAENVEVRRWLDPPRFPFPPKNHWEIGENLKLMDFARAGKISGSRFAVLAGDAARLTRALMNFMLELHIGRHGSREIWPPWNN